MLVVDDEAAIRSVLKRFLERGGAQVRTADSGEAALLLIREEPFDVVLLDIRMPGMGGGGFYKLLATERPELQARTIFLTGDVSALDSALEIPRERVVFKPIPLAQLEQAVLRVAR